MSVLLGLTVATTAVPAADAAVRPSAIDHLMADAQAVTPYAQVDVVLDAGGAYEASGGAGYVALGPVRLLDTRTGNGLSGAFVADTPRTVQITGRGGIPADAVSVTVNLTVTGATSGGYVSLTPEATASPKTSTLNFPAKDVRANGVTVPLGPGGTLSIVYKPGTSPPGPNYPAYDSGYHSPRELAVAIQTIERQHRDIVRLITIGKSYQGREIWAAKISDNVAVDEDEPEVLIDALHHAREHLTVEQALYLFQVLAGDYSKDATVKRLVDSREIWIIFALNPDGWVYDLDGGTYVGWRKNRQPNPGSTAVGTDLNRNYGYHWGCCGGSSGNKAAWNYRGSAAWSAVETRRLRDFVLSRVVDGKQQIRTHVTLHTNGELVLWPYGYTKTDVPADMTADDHATFVAMGKAMAKLNGYTAQQSSDLYVTDGDQIDWLYGSQHIFSFTFELYPTETVAHPNDFDPPDEVIAAQVARNRGALLYLIDMAACPYAAIGKDATYCPS
jgi:carboxypeptidase T